MCTKANRTLAFLRRNLYQCPQDIKEEAYEGLVHQLSFFFFFFFFFEYGSCVWDLQCVVLHEEIERFRIRLLDL